MYGTILHAIVQAIEFVAAIIIVVASAKAVWELLVNAVRSCGNVSALEVRLRIGQQLVLALELLIAADILKTVLAPTLEDLAFLGGIILIRTVLSLSIAYELRSSTSDASLTKSAAGNPGHVEPEPNN